MIHLRDSRSVAWSSCSVQSRYSSNPLQCESGKSALHCSVKCKEFQSKLKDTFGQTINREVVLCESKMLLAV